MKTKLAVQNKTKCCVYDDRGYYLGNYDLDCASASEVEIQGSRYRIKRWEHEANSLHRDEIQVLVAPVTM